MAMTNPPMLIRAAAAAVVAGQVVAPVGRAVESLAVVWAVVWVLPPVDRVVVILAGKVTTSIRTLVAAMGLSRMKMVMTETPANLGGIIMAVTDGSSDFKAALRALCVAVETEECAIVLTALAPILEKALVEALT